VFGALLACVATIGLAGCGKMNTGGENTNFPYSWKEEGRGTVLLKLDGTYGPEDYRWGIASTDESVLQVKVVKKEKKGLITYRIKPLKEGSAQIVFVRQREMTQEEGASGSGASEGTDEAASMEESFAEALYDATEIDGQDALQNAEVKDEQEGAADLPEEDPSAAAEAAEAALAASEAYEEYLDRFRAKDVIGEIKIRFDAEPTGKRGKLKLHLVLATTQEHKGVMQDTDGDVDYKLWENSDGSLQIRLPELEESWSFSWEGEYVPVEDQEIPGIVVSKPEIVNGKYIILEILEEGFIEGANCYTVRGFDQGSAVLTFSNPEFESRLVIHVMISRDGRISVLSHSMTAPQG